MVVVRYWRTSSSLGCCCASRWPTPDALSLRHWRQYHRRGATYLTRLVSATLLIEERQVVRAQVADQLLIAQWDLALEDEKLEARGTWGWRLPHAGLLDAHRAQPLLGLARA